MPSNYSNLLISCRSIKHLLLFFWFVFPSERVTRSTITHQLEDESFPPQSSPWAFASSSHPSRHPHRQWPQYHRPGSCLSGVYEQGIHLTHGKIRILIISFNPHLLALTRIFLLSDSGDGIASAVSSTGSVYNRGPRMQRMWSAILSWRKYGILRCRCSID